MSVADRTRQSEVQRPLDVGANDETHLNFKIQEEVRVLVAEAVKEERKKSKQAASAAGIMSRVLAATRKLLSRPPESKAYRHCHRLSPTGDTPYVSRLISSMSIGRSTAISTYIDGDLDT